MTSEQIKMARAALGWSIDQLADRTDVSSRTIKRIEAQVGLPMQLKQIYGLFAKLSKLRA